jgi:DNA-binding LacI/PurR family transcriptional regulator
MAKRATLKSVAQQAGVSYQTVSRVINGSDDVAPETREVVLATIRALDYQPNMTARALSQQKTYTIVVSIPYEPNAMFADPHLLHVIYGIDRAASLHGYNMLISTRPPQEGQTTSHRHLQHLQRLLKRHVVDGIIIEKGKMDDYSLELEDQDYPVVISGYTEKNIPSVHPDDEGGAYVLTQHLLALGHRRIGAIGGKPTIYPGMLPRLHGYERAFRDVGLPVDPQLLLPGDFTLASGYAGAAQLMQMSNPPTAIFAFNDRMALGALRWLREHDYRVPDDISLAGFDDIPDAELSDPPLTTIRLSQEELGRKVASLLFDIIDGHKPVQTEFIQPNRLIIRKSTAIAPNRS